MPHALLLGVGLHQGKLLLGAAGQAQIIDGDIVDREHGRRGAELRGHIADSRTVGQRDFSHTFAVELHKLADHSVLTQHLRDGQHHVSSGGPGGDLTGEFEPNHPWDQHGDRLAQHRCLSLNTAHAPAEHAQAVLHSGVRVSAHAGVRVGAQHTGNLASHDHPGQGLDVDLVDNAHSRGDDLEVIKGSLSPAQELVALTVALVLDVHIALNGISVAEGVDLHRVVDHHFGRCQGVDLRGVATEIRHCLTHCGQVDYAGNPGEVLHQDATGGELDLFAGLGVLVPVAEGLDVLCGDIGTVLGTQQVLQQNLKAVREGLISLNLVQPKNLVLGTIDVENAFCTETVHCAHAETP